MFIVVVCAVIYVHVNVSGTKKLREMLVITDSDICGELTTVDAIDT